MKQKYIIITAAKNLINFAIIYLVRDKNFRVDGMLEMDFLVALTKDAFSPPFSKNIFIMFL